MRWAIAEEFLDAVVQLRELCHQPIMAAAVAEPLGAKRSRAVVRPRRRARGDEDHAARSVSIPYRAALADERRYQPRRAAVKSIPASSDAKVAPSIWTRCSSVESAGSWKLPASSRFASTHQPEPSNQKGLRDPSSLVEEEVEVPVDGVEPQPAHRARERVEAAAHVHRLDDDEHPHGSAGGSARAERSHEPDERRLVEVVADVDRELADAHQVPRRRLRGRRGHGLHRAAVTPPRPRRRATDSAPTRGASAHRCRSPGPTRRASSPPTSPPSDTPERPAHPSIFRPADIEPHLHLGG
ncbi:MAG UNVERIFIED_CONTAM: hypothetical protein LVT10_02825, partial [Anaerolineae bacterium]